MWSPPPHSYPLPLEGVDFYERFFTYKVDFCEDGKTCKELCYIYPCDLKANRLGVSTCYSKRTQENKTK